jgi:biotin transport system substrate-specific component
MTAAARKTSGHSLPYQAAAVVAGVVAMAAASRAAIPIGPVPITLQTYALFVLAGVFGGEITLIAVGAWLACAALGLPVLANGAAGWRAIMGPGLGFLAGMALAGWACGRMTPKAQGWLALFALFAFGHALVLAGGWAGQLGHYLTPRDAFYRAVLPFIPGALVKSLAAALTVRLVAR